jgi:hypothetical protein
MKYKKTHASRITQCGTVKFIEITSSGKPIAECRTVAMADKIIKGLQLVDEERKKMDSFRL